MFIDVKKFIKSFGYAFCGLKKFISQEQNIKVQLLIGCMVVLLSIWLRISTADWLLVIFLVFFIPGLEIFNGIVEELANLLNLPYNKTAFLRNLAAGLVLWFSLFSIIIGIMILGKYA